MAKFLAREPDYKSKELPPLFLRSGSHLLLSSPTAKAVAGVGLASLAFFAQEYTVHADDQESADTEATQISLQATNHGDSPWRLMKRAGFTDQEAFFDIINRHGLTIEEAQHYVMHIGDTWVIDAETLNKRLLREPHFTFDITQSTQENPAPTQSQPATETVVPAQPMTPSDNTRAEAGPTITEATLPSEEVLPETFTLNAGETIAGEVVELNIPDPNNVITRILEENGLSSESAEYLTTDDILVVPEEYRDEFALRANRRPESLIGPVVPGLAKAYLLGDSISVGMKNLGNIEEQAYTLGIDMDVNAKGGISLGDALKTVDINTLLTYNAVVIELGTNAPENDETYETTLRNFLTELHETAFINGIKAPMVYIFNLHEAEGADVKISDEDRNPILGKIVYDYAAIGERISLIDWNKFATENPFVYAGSDGIHPSDYPTMATYVLDEMRTLYKEPQTESLLPFPVGEYVMPAESYWKLAPGYYDMVQEMDLTQSQKEFVLFVIENTMHQVALGMKVNPIAMSAQAIHETGYGTSYIAQEGYNYFGSKASEKWLASHPGQFVGAKDDEYKDGQKIQSKFKKFNNATESFADHAGLIDYFVAYEDSRMCRFDTNAYVMGLVHELRMDGSCEIGKYQGEDGVMSYATDKEYAQKILNTIDRNMLDKLIIVDEDVRQKMLTEQWLAENGAGQ